MDIGSLGATGANSASQRAYFEKAAEKISEKPQTTTKTNTEAEKTVNGDRDKFVHSIDEKPVTYSNTKTGALEADTVRSLNEARMASYSNMLTQMITKQADQVKNNFFVPNPSLGSLLGNSESEEIDSFDNDPTYGVDATATRIMDMAKALSGGDASKLEELRKAVQKGFGGAQKSWHGEMPSITGKTYTEVMKRFDDWAKESGVTAEVSATD
ncbi:MAG: hypothetical protein RR902_03145 [Oscillospiraceae bacterium]